MLGREEKRDIKEEDLREKQGDLVYWRLSGGAGRNWEIENVSKWGGKGIAFARKGTSSLGEA